MQHTGSRHAGFSSCSKWPQFLQFLGPRAQAQYVWRMGLVALCTACRILLNQRSNLCPLHWQADSYSLCNQGSPKLLDFNVEFFFFFTEHQTSLIYPYICIMDTWSDVEPSLTVLNCCDNYSLTKGSLVSSFPSHFLK